MKYKSKLIIILYLTTVSFCSIAENFALIMGISDYQRQPLAGVKKDIKTAKLLAKHLNIPVKNIEVRKDKNLTLAGMRHVIKEFGEKIKPGDQAFIYYSGHGTSYTKPNTNGECEQALVSQDMKFLSKAEFSQDIANIAKKASKTFVFLDACFSGGIALSKMSNRSNNEIESTSKFFLKSNGDSCANISNYNPKIIRDFGIEDAKETPNYYLLASSGQTQVSIDGGLSYGGYATTAFYDCLNGKNGVDTNNDSIITISEVQQCAQNIIDQKISNNISQSSSYPFTAQTLTSGVGPGSNVPIAFSSNTNTNSGNKINAMALLDTIKQSADSTHKVKILASKNSYTIGEDYLEMSVESNKPGYLTIFSVGSSGKIFQIFPNEKDASNKISAQTKLNLPRPSWRMPANGPKGTDRFLAIVSNTPDLFSGLGSPAGPFSMINNNSQEAKALMIRLKIPVNNCKPRNRDFGIEDAQPCNNSYGASYIDVKEVY